MRKTPLEEQVHAALIELNLPTSTELTAHIFGENTPKNLSRVKMAIRRLRLMDLADDGGTWVGRWKTWKAIPTDLVKGSHNKENYHG